MQGKIVAELIPPLQGEPRLVNPLYNMISLYYRKEMDEISRFF